MKSFELKGESRTIAERSSDQAKALKAMRRQNRIPCVIYGGEKNINFSVAFEDVRKLVYTPHIYVVDLYIDGEKHNAILKELQFHPVKDTILHIDFLEINEEKPIVMNVPIKLNGLPEGVKAGGKLMQARRSLKVKALYNVIPEHLDIDVTDLKLGKSKKVADLHFDGLELVDPKTAVICSVNVTRQSLTADTTAAADATAAAAPAAGATPAPAAN